MKLPSGFSLFIFSALAMLSVSASASSYRKVSSADLRQIQSVADTQGYAPIVVSFNVDSSLSNLLNNPSGIPGQAEMESSLLASLGKEVIHSTVYRSWGTSSIYVRKAALPIIDADPDVTTYWFDRMADTHRTTGTTEDIDSIIKQIVATGSADVEAVLNIAHYDLGDPSPAVLAALNGQFSEWQSAQSNEIPQALLGLKSSLSAVGLDQITVLSMSGATLKLRVTHEELYALQSSPFLRNLRLIGSDAIEAATPVHIPANVLQLAQGAGSVTLLVMLRRSANYSHFISKVPDIALQTQTEIIRSTIKTALSTYGPDEISGIEEFPGSNFFFVNMTLKGVQHLINNPDPSFAGVGASPSVTLLSTQNYTANAVGPITSQSISVGIAPTTGLIEQPGATFVAVQLLNGQIYVLGPAGWSSLDQTSPVAYSTGILHPFTAQIVSNLNLSDLAGANVYIGYGRGDTEIQSWNDMLANLTFQAVYTVR